MLPGAVVVRIAPALLQVSVVIVSTDIPGGTVVMVDDSPSTNASGRSPASALLEGPTRSIPPPVVSRWDKEYVVVIEGS